MKRKLPILLLALLIAAVFLVQQIFFIVHTASAVVVTTFGKPADAAITEPGLYLKWPRPVQKAYRFDTRIQCLEGSYEQTLTKDGKTIVATAYLGWRVDEPVKFLERVGTVAEAERSLEGLVRNYKNGVIGSHPLSHLINVDTKALRFAQIESEMLAAIQPEARARYGVEVVMLGIRKIGLPETITEAVFQRMREERRTVSERYRSEGAKEAALIRADADKRARTLLADAEASAKRIRADGDAAAAEYYATFEKNPELAMFLRKLEVLEQTLKKKATVVLGTDTEPYDLLRGAAPFAPEKK